MSLGQFCDSIQYPLVSESDDFGSELIGKLFTLSKAMLVKPAVSPEDASAIKERFDELSFLKEHIEQCLELHNSEIVSMDKLSEIRGDLLKLNKNVVIMLDRLATGSKLMSSRLKTGMKVKDIALVANMDPGYLSKLENFTAGPPSETVLSKLATALGVKYSDLASTTLGDGVEEAVRDIKIREAKEDPITREIIERLSKLNMDQKKFIKGLVDEACRFMESNGLLDEDCPF